MTASEDNRLNTQLRDTVSSMAWMIREITGATKEFITGEAHNFQRPPQRQNSRADNTINNS